MQVAKLSQAAGQSVDPSLPFAELWCVSCWVAGLQLHWGEPLLSVWVAFLLFVGLAALQDRAGGSGLAGCVNGGCVLKRGGC